MWDVELRIWYPCTFQCLGARNVEETEHLLKIFKIQVDDIILPWVADGFSMYWWVPMSLYVSLPDKCLKGLKCLKCRISKRIKIVTCL